MIFDDATLKRLSNGNERRKVPPEMETQTEAEVTSAETKVETFHDMHKYPIPKLGERLEWDYVMDVNTANALILLVIESRVSTK